MAAEEIVDSMGMSKVIEATVGAGGGTTADVEHHCQRVRPS